MTGRRWLLIAAAGVVLALAAVTLVIFGPGSDPYHQTAEQVTSHAGIAKHEPCDDGAIFAMADGEPWKQNHMQRGIINAGVKAAGLPPHTTSHDLRHSYASWLLQAGESVVTVADRLGHTDATLVMRVYGHLVPGQEDRTRKAIDGLWAQADRNRTVKITRVPDQR